MEKVLVVGEMGELLCPHRRLKVEVHTVKAAKGMVGASAS